MWYNPPFSQNVQTNVGKSFLRTVERSIPPGHPLHKIFNQNTQKLSYSCMPNVRNIIDNQREKSTKSCNCRKPAECPINGNCLQKSVIYQATVTNKSDGSKETYIGLTKNEFKKRFNGHKSTFKNVSKRYSTELSKHLWNLKDKNIDFEINWTILRKSKPYNNKSRKCNLCLLEKYYIICKPEIGTLNKRTN